MKLTRRSFLKGLVAGFTALLLPKVLPAPKPKVPSCPLVGGTYSGGHRGGEASSVLWRELALGVKRQSSMLLDNLGIVVTSKDLPSFSRRALRYLRTPDWLKWTMPKAGKELRSCMLIRQTAMLNRVLEAFG